MLMIMSKLTSICSIPTKMVTYRRKNSKLCCRLLSLLSLLKLRKGRVNREKKALTRVRKVSRDSKWTSKICDV